jgi:hypothetical protein
LETAEPPTTVKGLRAFNGAYKFLSKVLPSYCDALDPLEAAVAGRESKETIKWTDTLLEQFARAKAHLSKAKTITLPRRDDELKIITDAAISKLGIAATLFVVRNGKRKLAGFFNAKLKPYQQRWLLCEIEALAIGSAITFFAPYIIQSRHRATVLTDSRPCVQAYEKLCRGEFSSSARVLTFLSTIANFGAALLHIKGDLNATADFSSRNPAECDDNSCQICKFMNEQSSIPVRSISVQEALSSLTIEHYITRAAWKDLQRSDKDLRRLYAHTTQGTRPSPKD